jgi:polar amino acid transport system substrate-binding protein
MSTFHRRTIITGLSAAALAPFLDAAAFAQAGARLPPPSREAVASLAPSGRLRAAVNLGNIVLAQKDSATGALTGVIVDMTHELAKRLGVPLDVITYDTGGKIAPALATDHWDVGYLGDQQAREAGLVSTAPYLYVDATYMVRNDAPYRTVADLDRPGVRVTAALNSAYDLYLSKTLKNATIVRAPTSGAAIELFVSDKLDAAAGVRQNLLDGQKLHLGLRILTDAFTRVDQAMCMPPGREVGFKYLSAFVEEMKASGLVRRSLDATEQTAAMVAPPAAI